MPTAAEPTGRKDRLVGLGLSAALHLAVLLTGGWALFRPAQYGVEQGNGGLEVYLVAAPRGRPAEEGGESRQPFPTELPSGEMVLPQLTPASPPKPPGFQGDGSSPVPGRDATAFYSPGGGESEAKPAALSNPAPPYPPLARRLGQEGKVTLRIAIDKTGRATRVEVQRSSGFPLLDESALKTVCCWKFVPARTAGMVTASVASLQVRFVLKDKEE